MFPGQTVLGISAESIPRATGRNGHSKAAELVIEKQTKVLTCIARGDPSTRPGRESPRQKEPPWMADVGRQQAFTEFHSISWGVHVSFNSTHQLQRNEEAYDMIIHDSYKDVTHWRVL